MKIMMLKNLLIYLLLILATADLLAQSHQDTLYYTKNWKQTESRKDAIYFKILEIFDSINNWRSFDTYFINGQKQADGQYDGKHGSLKTGRFVFYHENGTKSEEGDFFEDKKNGSWKGYHENGNLKYQGQYMAGYKNGSWMYWYNSSGLHQFVNYDIKQFEDSVQIGRVVDYWDSTGNQRVSNGTGNYQTFHPNGKLQSKGSFEAYRKVGKWIEFDQQGELEFSRTYERGILINQELGRKHFEIETQDNDVYTIVDRPAEPKGGMPAFMDYLSKNMIYPKEAKRLGTEGRVFIQYIVDIDGTLTNVEVVKGIGMGCDEEAMRVISEAPKWRPGMQRGRPVKQKMIMPILFRLSKVKSTPSESKSQEPRIKPTGNEVGQMALNTTQQSENKSARGVKAASSTVPKRKRPVFKDGEYIEYFNNGKKSIVGQYQSNKKNGLWTTFYPSGRMESQGNFEQDVPKGQWMYWYPSGNRMEMSEYELLEDGINTKLMIDFWDSLGNPLVVGGNGEYTRYSKNGAIREYGKVKNSRKEGKWVSYRSNGKVYYNEFYKNGHLINGKSFDENGKSYYYELLYTLPEPKIGLHKLYKRIEENLGHQNLERMNKLDHQLEIKVIVFESGQIKDVIVENGISVGIENRLRRVMSYFQWIPGTRRGKPIETSVSIPYHLAY